MKHKICKVVFYGWSRISEFYLKCLADTEIQVVCIIENLKTDKVGEKIISGGVHVETRGLKEYPSADAIIIADFYNKNSIKKKLQQITDIPIYTDDDILA